MRSDEELMQEVSCGDRKAYEELVRRHQSLAVGLARNLLNSPEEAEDVAQEAFLKILRNADNYEPSASFRTYLSRVVTRLCYDRTEKNRPSSYDPREVFGDASSTPNPEEDVLDDERRRSLREALADLPDRQRTAIVLRTTEEFSYEQIAEIMDTTKKAVERLLARARDRLRGELQEYKNRYRFSTERRDRR